MDEMRGYAVFFFDQALEALGAAIKPYLQDGPAGPHVLCHEIDTGGALIELTLQGTGQDGRPLSLELMVPTQMVRMVVSARSDGSFGFGPRAEPAATTLPPVGPTAAPATVPPPTPAGAPPPTGTPGETLKGGDLEG